MHKRVQRTCAILALTSLGLAGVASAQSDFRDPTRPWRAPTPVSEREQRFVVNAIIVSDDRRVAIVNGKRVGEGQTVSGATIVEIQKDAVRLDVDGRQQTLHLRQSSKRQ